MTFEQRFYPGLSQGGFRRLAYTEWGRGLRTIVCVHGLTQHGRYFDALANDLAIAGFRVICPDVTGRGLSDRMNRPEQYGYPQYLIDMVNLLSRLDVTEVDWIGTSMGGLIGMMLAAMPNSPIARLVINDIGALVPKAGLDRIATYVDENPVFQTFQEAEAYLRRIFAQLGELSDAQWQHLTTHSTRRRGDGRYVMHFDPAIGQAFKAGLTADVDLWHVYDAIRCPTLLLRGEASDILPAGVAEEMTRRGPKAKLATFSGCGHAPALMDPAQIVPVKLWLSGHG